MNIPINLPKRGAPVPIDEVLELCTAFGLHELGAQIDADPPPKPFTTDGCSVWPDSWKSENDLFPWCLEHDLAYWYGRPNDEVGRLKADAKLMVRIAENVSVDLAEKMFAGVRVGGAEWLPTPWRWGYGRD